MTKILLVEDHADLAQRVSDYLSAHGFDLEHIGDGDEAQEKISLTSFDLLILDWDLPGTTGVQICRELRERGDTTPVLLMTGRKEVAEKEIGFDSGADDYITKPFSMRELLARVKALVRRSIEYSPAPTNVEPYSGLVLGQKYRLQEKIAVGGMAVIWKALDTSTQRVVAVKICRTASDESIRCRFIQECELMAQINHPNVASVFDAGGLQDRYPYLVMELIEGQSLRDLISSTECLSLETALSIAVMVCEGLGEAHKLGIVHRDIKPDNIMLCNQLNRSDSVKLVDFGIARADYSKERLTEEGELVGTMEYLAPEVLNGFPADSRSDIYAFGILLYEMLTGQVPFSAQTREAVMMMHLRTVPKDLSSVRNGSLPAAIDTIAHKCLEKDPLRRYQSAESLRVELLAILARHQLPDATPSVESQ